MQELTIFKFENNTVETIIINDEILFEIYSTGKALGQSVNVKEKEYPRRDRIDENIKNAEIQPVFHNGKQYINEKQLYDLMLEMKTDKVKPFRKWVTNEVLPSIRKHGIYATDITIENMIANPDFAIHLLTELKKERDEKQKLSQEKQQLESANDKLRPKAEVYDFVMDTNTLTSLTDTASSFGIHLKQLTNILIDLGYLKRSKTGKLKIDNKGIGYFKYKPYTLPNGYTVQYPYVTPKGSELIAFIVNPILDTLV